MSMNSATEWHTATWNPVRGSVNPRFYHERIEDPYRWKSPRRILVSPRSDLFHPLVSDGVITWVWLTMAKTPWHTYRIPTKHPDRMWDWFSRWNDLTGESDEPRLVRGPDATRAAHPSGRGQLYAAFLDELGATVPVGEPLPGAWPTFDWMEGARWWSTLPLFNVSLSAARER